MPSKPDCQQSLGKQKSATQRPSSCCGIRLHVAPGAAPGHHATPALPSHPRLFPQFLLWVGALIGFMWVPSSALVGYAHFSRYASGIFLVLQLVLLVNAAYEVCGGGGMCIRGGSWCL